MSTNHHIKSYRGASFEEPQKAYLKGRNFFGRNFRGIWFFFLWEKRVKMGKIFVWSR